jgi:hypothetical protein
MSLKTTVESKLKDEEDMTRQDLGETQEEQKGEGESSEEEEVKYIPAQRNVPLNEKWSWYLERRHATIADDRAF